MKTSQAPSLDLSLKKNKLIDEVVATDCCLAQYTQFVRPATGNLLQLLKLDIHYHNGDGNWLFYDQDSKTIKVFDATGGYGANLHGHKNQRLTRKAMAAIIAGAPNNTQGSIRRASAQLGAMLNEMITEHTQKGPWVTTLSNSGTEAVEAAIKHSLMFHRAQMHTLEIELTSTENQFKKNIQTLSVAQQNEIAKIISNEIPDLSPNRNLLAMLENLAQKNRNIINQDPCFIALKEGFHGKTLGSLEVTYNPDLKQQQKHHTIFARKDSPQNLEFDITSNEQFIIQLEYKNDSVIISRKSANKIAAAIVEPIQGEAGIKEIDRSVLLKLRELANNKKFLLIFDEIQAGLYRTGEFLNSTIPADIYCLSKALGGGFAKIAATSIIKSKYIEMFGLLHTSTFAEDEFSSTIAIEVLKMLKEDNTLKERVTTTGLYLKNRLQYLTQKYPSIVKEIRGKGLFQAIEFSDILRQKSFETKLFCDIKMVGHLLSSALLHHEKIRMAPSLSNPYSLRIEPSIYTSHEEIDYLVNGLEQLVRAIKRTDTQYFFGHLFPDVQINNATRLKKPLTYSRSIRPVAVFLNHLIDTDNAKKLVTAFKNVPNENVDNILLSIFDLVEFEIYDRKILKGKNGIEIEIIMLSIPLTSKILFKNNSPALSRKIQNAICYAKELGATTVGLGQFTSIVSKNGIKLNPMGMNLTTGNAYTISLSVEAALKASNSNKPHIGCIGAAGNIVSTATTLLADHANKLTLFYHTNIKKSTKLQESIKSILEIISESKKDSPLIREIKSCIPQSKIANTNQLLDILNKLEEYFKIETDLNKIKSCDLIYTGTNSRKPFIGLEHLKNNAVVIDVGVPANVKSEVHNNQRGIRVITGGLANFPKPYNDSVQIDIPAFPLNPGESFACMAETFILSLAQVQNVVHTGNLNKRNCQYINELATKVGFTLGEFKIINSL